MRITIRNEYEIFYIAAERWTPAGRKEMDLSVPGKIEVARTVLLDGRESVMHPVQAGNYYAENIKNPRERFVSSLRLLARLVDEDTIRTLSEREYQREYLEAAAEAGYSARESDII